MPQIGPMEILIVGAIALIVFGPQRLPEMARAFGKAAAELRRMATEVRSEFDSGLRVDDDSNEEDATETASVDDSVPGRDPSRRDR